MSFEGVAVSSAEPRSQATAGMEPAPPDVAARSRGMHIAMLAPRPTVKGPLPKLTPLLAEALGRLGCEVKVLPWGRGKEGERLPAKVFGRARDVMSARRAIVRGGFPVALVNTAHDWFTLARDLALVYLVPRRTTIVLFFHGSQAGKLSGPGSWAFKRATAALLSRTDGVLVLSEEERQAWQSFSPRSSIAVVRYPRPVLLDVDVASAVARDELPTVLCVSRLMRTKGVYELVQATALVQESVPCRLVLAGAGPETEPLRELARELNVEALVELTGYVEGEALVDLYRRSDVFAMPTTHDEGFPYVILEAMTAGLPIVTTATRGPADELIEGTHVLFVPAHDPGALATALERILADPALARRMSEANQAKVREFDADKVALDYLEALESAMR